MRIWCKLFEKNHMLKDTVMENYDISMSRTAKVYDCLERACYEFDLEKPMWLDKNKREFISHARTCFYQDNFIEHIDFDYLDFQVIEEYNFLNIVILIEKKLLIISPPYAILPLRYYSVRE